MDRIIKKVKKVNGVIELPGDRSISHRALILASLADGVCEIYGCSTALECEGTKNCLRKLGIAISGDNVRLEVEGQGIEGYSPPESDLDVGNSAAGLSLLTGILAGFEFESILTGNPSLNNRSYKTLVQSLEKMGAKIESNDFRVPLKIKGTHLAGSQFSLSDSSAHLKSALLLAGLKAEGETIINEAIPGRDHTERLINHFGIPIEIYMGEEVNGLDDLDRRMKRIKQKQMYREKGTEVHIWGIAGIMPAKIYIPGDVTSAAPLIAAATILKNSNLQIKMMGFNPTRSGFVDLVKRMGANFSFSGKRELSGEPVIDLGIRTASLRGRRLGGAIVHNMIDEIPILAVLASQSEGTTVIREAEELRRRETDRLHATFLNLRKMGAKVGELRDGLVIEGKSNLRGAEIDCLNDHRLVMSFTVAGMVAEGETLLKNIDGVENSFPGFWETISTISENSAFA
ncbi:MAG: 3-phosphoshikimate 1-carboxyvinyltransferase [candidate division Zixibacteria bacterium CG_4_9_14_3_um_filter_46_8]|nr:MAG: 3-phosphoshikimate 1-carboxyvinyltransferase [candidate division Zixibacteria bacterium CG_4_9_14_3_um_filter_46_8]